MLHSTSSSSSSTSASLGITGGYEGNSFTLKVLIAFFLGLSIYNALELQVLIFTTFRKYRGLYFWSLFIAGLGIIPYSMGFIFKYFSILRGGWKWFSMFLLGFGWYPMVTGQAVVLWSRLNLIVIGVRGDKILLLTKWMIIINVFILHIPTTVLSFGSNSDSDTAVFVRGYSVMEKIQMCGFFLQEVIMSSIYMVETARIIRGSLQKNTRRMMYQLFAINILIIVMDVVLLGLECASLYILETITKPLFYSIKLKLEFAILGKLVQFVGRPTDTQSSASVRVLAAETASHSDQMGKGLHHSRKDKERESEVLSFVDQTNLPVSGANPEKSQSSRVSPSEMDIHEQMARMKHLENIFSRGGQ